MPAVVEAVECHRRTVVQADLLAEAQVARTAQAVMVEAVVAVMILVAASTVAVLSMPMVHIGTQRPGAFGADLAVHLMTIHLTEMATKAVKMQTNGADVLCMKTRAMV